MVCLTIQRELRVADAVSVTPDERPEVGGVVDIAIEVVVAKHDVSGLTFGIGNHERHNRAAPGHDAGLHAFAVLQREQLYLLAVRGCSECRTSHCSACLCGAAEEENSGRNA